MTSEKDLLTYEGFRVPYSHYPVSVIRKRITAAWPYSNFYDMDTYESHISF